MEQQRPRWAERMQNTERFFDDFYSTAERILFRTAVFLIFIVGAWHIATSLLK